MKEKNIETLYEGKHIRFLKKDTWEFVERKNISGIVIIIAVTDDNKIILTEQYRPPVSNLTIELPAGLAGDISGKEDESFETAAIRELEEETGYEAKNMEFLIQGPASAGLSNEIITFYRATGLKKVHEGGGDSTENIKVHEIPVQEASAWLKDQVKKGILVDPKTYIGLYYGELFSV